MGRKKLSEFKAKVLLFSSLGKSYEGFSIKEKDLLKNSNLSSSAQYVVKVDQGVKKRFKKGLIALNISASEVSQAIRKLSEKGYSQFLVEPFLSYNSSSEKYIAFERVTEGIKIYYSKKGGVTIEENKDEIYSEIYTDKSIKVVADFLSLPVEVLNNIIEIFENNYFSFLEINPLVVDNGNFYFVDVACEVDSAAEFFVDGRWTSRDLVTVEKKRTDQEKEIENLSSQSQASFTYTVLNPDGSIFVLLSGGGASVVVADEIYMKGMHKELANYGEYSGNPNAEETYLYTKSLLKTLLISKSRQKVIILSGGVANFTDIRITFKGIIRAISEVSDQLQKQRVKVFVRRGGPYQEEGLMLMKEFLEKENLLGSIHGPDVVLTQVVNEALEYLKK